MRKTMLITFTVADAQGNTTHLTTRVLCGTNELPLLYSGLRSYVGKVEFKEEA